MVTEIHLRLLLRILRRNFELWNSVLLVDLRGMKLWRVEKISIAGICHNSYSS
jgi:hypothetical protein